MAGQGRVSGGRLCRMAAERGCNHAFVSRFILLPKFSLVQVEVNCDKDLSASGSGPMRVRIPQPPSPPGLLGPDPGSSNRERPATVCIAPPPIKIEMMPRSAAQGDLWPVNGVHETP
jgi:hypothetical protein